MNPEAQILQLGPPATSPTPPAEPATLAAPNPPTCNLQPSTSNSPPLLAHRGNGKVARLPKTVRDQINNLLLDGLSYPEIINRLGDAGIDLNPGHLCEWKKRGYQDWLQQREWLEHVTSKTDFSTDVLAAPDTASLHEAGLRIAAAQMFDQLARFAASAHTADAGTTPEIFARLVNALSRLTREALHFQKYHDASARERERQLKQFEPGRDLTHDDHDLFLKKVEEFFHVKLPRPAPASPPPQPPPHPESPPPPLDPP